MNIRIKQLILLLIILPFLYFSVISPVSAKEVSSTKVPVVRLHDGSFLTRPIDTVVNNSADWAFQTKSVNISISNADNIPIQNATSVITLVNYLYPYPVAFNNMTLTTDNNGNMILKNLLFGSYHMSISSPGYVSKEINIDTSISSLNVSLDSAYTFDDEFNDTQLDATKWDINSYQGSVVNENNGYLTLGSTNQQYAYFPFIQNHEPIQANQNYAFKVKFRFDNSSIIDFSRKTGGIMLGLSNTKYDPTRIFGNSPYINSTNMWLYSDLNTELNGIGTGHTYQTALEYTYIPYDTNWHTLIVTRTGGTYGGTTTIVLDNNVILTDFINIDPAKYIFMGVPGSTEYNGTWKQYPNLILDYVNIK